MTSPTAARRRPPGRYDEPSRLGGRLTAVVLGLLLLAVLVAAAFTVYARFAVQRAEPSVVDFQVLSDDEVRIDVQVRKPEGAAAYCLLRARGADGAEVGREVVEVAAPGDPSAVVRREHDLPTRERAVTGEAVACSLQPVPVPSRSP